MIATMLSLSTSGQVPGPAPPAVTLASLDIFNIERRLRKVGHACYEEARPGASLFFGEILRGVAHHWLFGSAGSLPNPPYRKLG